MKTPDKMHAMVLEEQGKPLQFREVAVPEPAPDNVLIKVQACGVCRTDLHVFDGELPHPKLPLILGHEIVGTVAGVGSQVTAFREGERIGVPWLGYTCGKCRYCGRGQENLCEHALFTGYTRDGGYAEYTVADQRYCFRLPATYSDVEAAPLLCAGLIGYRAYRMAGGQMDFDGQARRNPSSEHGEREGEAPAALPLEGATRAPVMERLGIYGFGAAAHLIAQVALAQGKKVYAFTRPGDREGQSFARNVGVTWVGDSDAAPPEELDAAIIFAPVGALLPAALRATDKGGTVVCGGIHMSDIPSFPYRLLWEERVVRSVANLTRADGEQFLDVAARVPIKVESQPFPLRSANEALDRLRRGALTGAAVLVMDN
jgi:alcohol dehydrogenase, propanol-preferring